MQKFSVQVKYYVGRDVGWYRVCIEVALLPTQHKNSQACTLFSSSPIALFFPRCPYYLQSALSLSFRTHQLTVQRLKKKLRQIQSTAIISGIAPSLGLGGFHPFLSLPVSGSE